MGLRVSGGNLVGGGTINGSLVVTGNLTVNGTITAAGVVQSLQGTATTGGGAQALKLGASGPHIYVGSGVPTISAVQGSLYLRTDGSSTSTRAYINTTGSTTWTAITTAA